MERQSKEEVLIEWFLGDSKEILVDLQKAVANAKEVNASIQANGVHLLDAVDQARTESVQAGLAHRQILEEIRAAQASLPKSLDAAYKRSKALLDHSRSRVYSIGIMCGLAGGVIGAVVTGVFLQSILRLIG